MRISSVEIVSERQQPQGKTKAETKQHTDDKIDQTWQSTDVHAK